MVLGRLYGASELLAVDEYTHLNRWAQQLGSERPAIRRGRMVNRGEVRNEPGDTSNPLYADLPNLPDRHSRADWAFQGK